VECEHQLLEGTEEAINVLRANLNHSDPIARLTAKCLLDWKQAPLIEFEQNSDWKGGRKTEYQQSLDYLDGLPARFEQSVARQPQATGVAAALDEFFQNHVADLMALRLVKGTDWPRWRALGVIFYLGRQKLPSTTAALIRFATETGDEKLRNAAVDVIKGIPDGELTTKIAAERTRLEKLNARLPPALAVLDHGP
jgi:hypothetical protein